MSTTTWNIEVESPVAAGRMFMAAILDWHHLGPKLSPDTLAGGSVDGDHVRQLDFTSDMPYSYVKERMVEHEDHDEHECLLTLIEGGHLGTKIKSESTHYKIVPTSDGDGCIVNVVTTTEPLVERKGEGEEEDIVADKAKELAMKQFKAVEAYLLDHPEEYVVAAEAAATVGGQVRTRSCKFFPGPFPGPCPGQLPGFFPGPFPGPCPGQLPGFFPGPFPGPFPPTWPGC